MAYKFLKDTDFTYKIRNEIKAILAGAEGQTKLETAENAALAQINHYIGHRYDMVTVFAKENDERDGFIIQIVIALMLYQLYGQTGMKDIPEHRKVEYQDVIDWLIPVGKGQMNAMLPSIISEENPGEVRINSEDQQQWEY